ncbi:hypothetical protein [Pelagicoccus sp. SDUM812002]|uniref:hypothetical protein n=1 Tax=Pelagicoccus sp. SDUM812002 TaxID=3041266 RepID=UPI002810B30F|nr:hypothetical protein [Pelagicoccus sp. SDUM812002]
MGTALVVSGGFYLLICLLAALVMATSEPMPGFGQPIFEGSFEEGVSVQVRNVVEGAMVLQLLLGGILGIATIWAGQQVRRRRSPEPVKWVSIVNLLYFPVGTTVGALVLIGLGRDSVKRGFESSNPPHRRSSGTGYGFRRWSRSGT